MVVSLTNAGWQITRKQLLPFGEICDWRGFLAPVRQDPPAMPINTDHRLANAATVMTRFMAATPDSLVSIQYAPSVPAFPELTGDASSGVVYTRLGGVLNTSTNPRAPR